MVRRLHPLRRKVVRDLWHLRSQMLAIAVVMACGIAMFVTLRSMYGWLREAQASYYADYRFADVFAAARRVPASLERRLRSIPGVSAVDTRVVTDVTLDVPGLNEPATGRLVSVPVEGRPALNAVHLARGRWIAPGRAAEVIASEAFARANGLAPGDSIPAVINGRWQQLRVVGTGMSPEYVYEIRGLGDIFPDNRRFGVLWMSRPALAGAFQMEGAFNDVAFALSPGAVAADVIAAADRLLAPYGGTGAYGRADQISHLFLRSEIEETRITSVLIPTIFLGVTAFLLNMVLARLVATQREQVGMFKAFGYSNGELARHYAQLALGPVLAGTLTGTLLGVWLAGRLATVYARFYQFPTASYHQDWSVVAAAIAVSVCAALLGALGAMRRVLLLPPAEAMRPEAPATFRAGPAERLGLQRLLRPAQRIILRNIERRPLRALVSAAGIALATAIVMLGWFMYDAIDVMKEIQFDAVQRQDVTVTFDHALADRAAWSLLRMDGVRRVEPFRTVPVRLRHGPNDRRAGVVGLAHDSRLYRLVDRDRATRPVPRGGLVLSDVLAGRLGLVAGDTVTVEVLEGRRPSRRITVTAVSRDVIGSSATMEIGALQALLGERTVSGAYLAVDPLRTASLYRSLKETPAVSGVVVRESVVRGFEQTIAESFLISIVTLVLFACVIAVGIVYNGARVALSERGRELASLRVLGFSRAEVTRLLLGEQALLTALGIPVGLLVGWGLALLIVNGFESDLFRIPLIIRRRTILFSLAVVGGAAVLSALAVRHRIRRLDLIAVLKTRE